VNLISDDINFDSYFAEQQVDAAKIKPASSWADDVVDRFYGQGAASTWTPAGFAKMGGKFDLRGGEVTLWAGVNGAGKTTYLSNVMLNVMQTGQKACIASPEMKPRDSMAKMTMQACGIGSPSIPFIRAFSRWTDDKLWVYDHVGRIATSRVLAVATYVRKELSVDHLVIDSLMKCGIGVDDYTGQKDFVDGLCSIARDTGLSIHLVCHMRKGENERVAPGKFDVKGAGEITDLADNLVIVWKNLHKAEELAAAEREKDPVRKEQLLKAANEKADAFVRIAKQRHHPWEGSFAFWFDKASQQFLEHERMRPTYMDLNLDLREAA
jgi:twinkle protein